MIKSRKSLHAQREGTSTYDLGRQPRVTQFWSNKYTDCYSWNVQDVASWPRCHSQSMLEQSVLAAFCKRRRSESKAQLRGITNAGRTFSWISPSTNIALCRTYSQILKAWLRNGSPLSSFTGIVQRRFSELQQHETNHLHCDCWFRREASQDSCYSKD